MPDATTDALLSEAADKIDELRRERDEARQERDTYKAMATGSIAGRPWNTNHDGYRAIFSAALTGICANPQFFGPLFQQSPEAAVEFADAVVLAAIESGPQPF